MAKKIKVVVKLQIPAGKANPAPPVGPALAQHGINLMQFCKEYNARTSGQIGNIIPAEITIYQDNSFKFKLKTPPAPELLRKAAGRRAEAVLQDQVVLIMDILQVVMALVLVMLSISFHLHQMPMQLM